MMAFFNFLESDMGMLFVAFAISMAAAYAILAMLSHVTGGK